MESQAQMGTVAVMAVGRFCFSALFRCCSLTARELGRGEGEEGFSGSSGDSGNSG